MTLPMMTSSISPTSMRDRCTAARMATAPRSGALSGDNPPRNFPMGVRAAETMTGMREVSGMVER